MCLLSRNNCEDKRKGNICEISLRLKSNKFVKLIFDVQFVKFSIFNSYRRLYTRFYNRAIVVRREKGTSNVSWTRNNYEQKRKRNTCEISLRLESKKYVKIIFDIQFVKFQIFNSYRRNSYTNKKKAPLTSLPKSSRRYLERVSSIV